MEEKLVSCDVARLAFKVGFNHVKANCFGDNMAYNIEGKLICAHQGNTVEGYVLAPTQAVLLKWFREYHALELLVYCNGSGWLWELNRSYHPESSSGGTHIMWSNDKGPNPAGQWETFEEATEDGIEVTLNYILNVKP